MKKLVSTIVVFALVLLFAFSMTACKNADKNDGTPSYTSAKSPAEIYTAVSAAAGFGGMTIVPTRDYADIYGIDASKVDQSVWYMSENPSLNADEVAIFKLNDESYTQELANLFKDRIARQLQVAETYSPAEAAKLQNAEVFTKGSWVYYCIGTEAEAMLKVFNTEIK